MRKSEPVAPVGKLFHYHLLAVIMLLLGVTFNATGQISPPAPVQPIPSPQQLDWQQMEFYMFVHFNMNTFTNQEWSFGDAPASTFNPTQLDTRQWARVANNESAQLRCSVYGPGIAASICGDGGEVVRS